MIGVSDSSPWQGLWIASLAAALVVALVWHWVRIGYRLKS